MALSMFVVDAFADGPYLGNPAGVAIIDAQADPEWMQAVAAEMRHAETAFVHPLGGAEYGLRWFTPEVEVDLCGHATLASAHVLFRELGADAEAVHFTTASGRLTCRLGPENALSMDFPAEVPEPSGEDVGPFIEALGLEGPVEVSRNRFDWLVKVESAAEVRRATPDFTKIRALGLRGMILTAEADSSIDADVISRFFAPQSGVDEDPVTGSAHCALSPFWASRLGRSRLTFVQASPRGGRLVADWLGERVELAGLARTFLRGELA